MTDGWGRVAADDVDERDDKPGERRELSDALGVDAFNFNAATIPPGERLSQNHYHYHENQSEMVFVTAGRVRVEVDGDSFDLAAGGGARFDAGPDGVHLVHNPFDEPADVVAIGWPPEGRYPVEQVATLEELQERRD